MFDRAGRRYVRTFFTTPTAVDADDSSEMLRKAAGLRGMAGPDVWVPDNEDATAPSMREEGVSNLIDVLDARGAEIPAEVHPRVEWHRDDPGTRRLGYERIRRLADPAAGAARHIDGFVIPEVGHIDDWKKADESIRRVEDEFGFDAGRFDMSVIIESGQAELALGELTNEMGKPTNTLERLFLLVDGEVDYTKDMNAITPTGGLPAWPELRHNTSRAASAVDLVAVDGPYDDIRDESGYRERMTDNRAKGMLGMWALTPGQVEIANGHALPPAEGSYRIETGDGARSLAAEEDAHVYDGADLTVSDLGDGQYRLTVSGQARELDADELHESVRSRLSYVPGLEDIVAAMDRFEEAKAAGRGAISQSREATVRIDGVSIDVSNDRMWDEATYQAARIPVQLFQEVWEFRPDQRDALRDRYGADVVDLAREVGDGSD